MIYRPIIQYTRYTRLYIHHLHLTVPTVNHKSVLRNLRFDLCGRISAHIIIKLSISCQQTAVTSTPLPTLPLLVTTLTLPGKSRSLIVVEPIELKPAKACATSAHSGQDKFGTVSRN